MSDERPAIPMELRRAVLVEAGHRCALPTCRHPDVDIDHIDPWEKVREHRFENLIALCPNCHRKKGKGEIDRKSLLAYKYNLPIVASRYTDMERRALAELGGRLRKGMMDQMLMVPGGSQVFFLMAIQDGLMTYQPASQAKTGTPFGMVETIGGIMLTAKGAEFADKWLAGKTVDNARLDDGDAASS